MSFNREQLKKAYSSLTEKDKEFVMSTETEESIDMVLTNIGITKDKVDGAHNEIFYAMLGLQSPGDAVNNIQKYGGVDTSNVIRLKTKLEEQIFSKINGGEEVKFTLNKPVSLPASEEPKPSINIGDSFTQAIINQAKAMRPLSNNQQPVAGSQGKAPLNLPVEEKQVQPATQPLSQPPTQPAQPRTNDPYREPIE